MNTQQLMLIAAVAAAIYLWMGGSTNATTTATTPAQNSPACAEAYRQQYSGGWEQMSRAQRLAVGLQASSDCEVQP